jgi:hypothetical protein
MKHIYGVQRARPEISGVTLLLADIIYHKLAKGQNTIDTKRMSTLFSVTPQKITSKMKALESIGFIKIEKTTTGFTFDRGRNFLSICLDKQDEVVPEKKQEQPKPKEKKDLMMERVLFVKECKQYTEKYGEDMVREFIKFWSEPSPKTGRMRWQDQDYFDVGRRMSTWSSKSYRKKNITW